MNGRKLVTTLIVYLILIIVGQFGILPTFFFDSDLGQSHSVFSPIAVLLDLGMYMLLTYFLVNALFWAYDRR